MVVDTLVLWIWLSLRHRVEHTLVHWRLQVKMRVRLPLKRLLVLEVESLLTEISVVRHRRLVSEGGIVHLRDSLWVHHRFVLADRTYSLMDRGKVAAASWLGRLRSYVSPTCIPLAVLGTRGPLAFLFAVLVFLLQLLDLAL